MSSDRHHLLRVYVRDHHAASAAGVALARRSANNNKGTEFEPPLLELADGIADDQQSLEDVMAWLAVSPSAVRLMAARAGELVARLKANGRFVDYSPSSRVVELEALTAGVSAKRQLWRTLRPIAAHDSTFADPVTLSELVAREDMATAQLESIFAMHDRAVELAFVESSTGSSSLGRSDGAP
jgi:hypothetical protein